MALPLICDVTQTSVGIQQQNAQLMSYLLTHLRDWTHKPSKSIFYSKMLQSKKRLAKVCYVNEIGPSKLYQRWMPMHWMLIMCNIMYLHRGRLVIQNEIIQCT